MTHATAFCVPPPSPQVILGQSPRTRACVNCGPDVNLNGQGSRAMGPQPESVAVLNLQVRVRGVAGCSMAGQGSRAMGPQPESVAVLNLQVRVRGVAGCCMAVLTLAGMWM